MRTRGPRRARTAASAFLFISIMRARLLPQLRGHDTLFNWLKLLSCTWLSVATLVLTTQASAELMNVTVDDQYPDPFTPSQNVVYRGSWRSASQSCDDCVVGLDVWRAYLSTWHESIYLPGATQPNTASFTFEGACQICSRSEYSDSYFTRCGRIRLLHHSRGCEHALRSGRSGSTPTR